MNSLPEQDVSIKSIHDMSNEEIYLEYFNNFLSVEGMADYYGVDAAALNIAILVGKSEGQNG